MNKAHDFRLQNTDAQWRTLTGLLKDGPVMLVFYPGDFTPVCTKQLCSYQDSLEEISKFGIKIVGISPDSIESHKKFSGEYKLSFELLSDEEKTVFAAYKVKSNLLFGITSRAVFVIDQAQNILYEKVETTPITHRKADDLLEILKKLREEKKI